MFVRFTKLTIRNFLSIGQEIQTVELDKGGLTLILGHNMDASGGVSRNGVGKTTIVQALCFALYGKPLTKIRANNLVNNVNNKNMFVVLEFQKGEAKYRIERGRKPNFLRFFVDNKEMQFEEDDQAQGENRHTQEEIERIVGMSHTLFSHIVALNTFTEPFLKMRNGDQKVVFEELQGIMVLSKRAEALSRLMKDTKEEIRNLEAGIKAATETNNRIEERIRQIEASSHVWERQHKANIEKLASEIEALDAIDFDGQLAAFDALEAYNARETDTRYKIENAMASLSAAEQAVATIRRELTSIQREFDALAQNASVARLQQDIERQERNAERHDLQAAKLADEIAAVEHDLANADEHTCQTCGQGLSGTEHLAEVMKRLEIRKASLTERLARERKEAEDRRAEAAQLRAELEAQASVSEKAKAALKGEMERVKANLEAAEREVQEKQVALQEAMEERKALGTKPSVMFSSRDEVYSARALRDSLARDLVQERQKENPYIAQIEMLKSTLHEINYEPLNAALDKFKHQDTLYRLLTNKDSFIRKKIIDQNLAYINSRINYYLEKLGLPHKVEVQPSLTVEISMIGREYDFEQLSRGEMNRVTMAVSWAFRDVWESLNGPMNLYFVDELLDQGMDEMGAEAGLAILKSFGRDRGKNVFLISHRDSLIGRIDRTLLVRKENDFSWIEEDAII